MSWTVGTVAATAGVTVRTLHHYDQIGLLSPSGRTPAGYRRYDYADLERLQRILAYRRLGFGLGEIATILDDAAADPVDHLRRQHALLTDRLETLQQMVTAVEKTMEARKMGINLRPDEMFEVFGEADPGRYADEAEQRWGDTDAWKQSQRKTSSYTKDDWLRIKAEAESIEAALAELHTGGAPADGVAAMDAAETHRAHLGRWFYDCPPAMHRGLGDLYTADERFTAHFDDRAPGLAAYVRDAIHANATRQE